MRSGIYGHYRSHLLQALQVSLACPIQTCQARTDHSEKIIPKHSTVHVIYIVHMLPTDVHCALKRAYACP